MLEVINILLISLGIALFYIKQGRYFFHYLILWITIIPMVYGILFSLDEESYWSMMTSLSRCLLILMLFNFTKSRNSLLRKSSIAFFVFLIFSIFLSFFRQTPIVASFKYAFGCLSCFASCPVLFNVKYSKNSLIRLLRLALYFEVAVGIIQLVIPSLNYKTCIQNAVSINLTPINGTLFGNNTYIVFISLLCFLVVYQDYKRNNRLSGINICMSLLVIYLVFESGVRTALLAILPLVVYFTRALYINNTTKKSRFIISTLLIISLSFVVLKTSSSFIGNSEIKYTQNATTNAERNEVLVSILLDSSFLIKHTTFALTYDVLKYFGDNIFFGPGLLFVGKGYDGYISMAAQNVTDATLAIYICEFGIIGLAFLIYYYRIYISKLNKNKTGAKLLFVYLLLVSITDSGIFFILNMIVFTWMIILDSDNQNAHKKHNAFGLKLYKYLNKYKNNKHEFTTRS